MRYFTQIIVEDSRPWLTKDQAQERAKELREAVASAKSPDRLSVEIHIWESDER